MKRKITSILAVVLILATVLATSAMAASPEPAVTVRVNGMTVDFPDGQPYVDANSRTMIPVRFVSEELGAKVRQTFSVTLTGSYRITILTLGGNPVALDLPITVKVAGMSEVYWR